MARIAQLTSIVALIALLAAAGCGPEGAPAVRQSGASRDVSTSPGAAEPDRQVARSPGDPNSQPPPTNRRLLLEELRRHDADGGDPLARPPAETVRTRPKRPVDSWVIFREAYKPLEDATCEARWTGRNRIEVITGNINRITLDLTRLPAGAPRRGPWNLQIDRQGIEITGRRGRIFDLVRSRGGRWSVDRSTLRKRR